MPQKGERKTINGVTGEWDGQTWRQVDVNASLAARAAAPLSEPTTFSEGFHKSEALKQNPVAGGAVGFAEGVVPGAVNAVVQAVPGLVSSILGTVKGTGHLLVDPVGTLTDAIEAVRGIPSKGYDMLVEAKKLAEQDPVAFGKQVGEVTGGVEAGILASKAVPLAPKPIARKVGSVMETVGKKGEWPIRMVGAHQLGSGNPLGIATIMAPEALQSAGGAIREFGGGEAPNPITQKDPLTGKKLPQMPTSTRTVDLKPTGQAIRIAPPTPVLGAAGEAVPYGGAEPVPYRATAKKALATEQLEAENARRLAEIERRKEGLEPGPQKVTEALSAKGPGGERVSASQTFAPPGEEGGGGDIADALENDPRLASLRNRRDVGANAATPLQVTKGLRAAAAGEPAMAVSHVPAGAPSAAAANAAAQAEAAAQQPAFLDPAAVESGRVLNRRVNQGASPTGTERRVRGVPNPIEEQLRRQLTGEPTPAPEGPQPLDPRITGQAPGEEIPSAKAAKVPVSDIPTRSSRTGGDLMSATPGLTVNDVKAIGLNPDIPIKTITPELKAKILEARKLRSVDYKADAQMNAMEKSMLAREPE